MMMKKKQSTPSADLTDVLLPDLDRMIAEVLATDEDSALNAIADARAGEPAIKVPLDELIEAITNENVHDEIDFGAPVRKERI